MRSSAGKAGDLLVASRFGAAASSLGFAAGEAASDFAGSTGAASSVTGAFDVGRRSEAEGCSSTLASFQLPLAALFVEGLAAELVDSFGTATTSRSCNDWKLPSTGFTGATMARPCSLSKASMLDTPTPNSPEAWPQLLQLSQLQSAAARVSTN